MTPVRTITLVEMTDATLEPSGSDADDPRLAPARAVLAVSGMHCASCVTLIEESLAEQVGVTDVSVDLDTGRARVDYDAATIDVEHLCAVVADVGYVATPSG